MMDDEVPHGNLWAFLRGGKIKQGPPKRSCALWPKPRDGAMFSAARFSRCFSFTSLAASRLVVNEQTVTDGWVHPSRSFIPKPTVRSARP